jgi:hypothetical protein
MPVGSRPQAADHTYCNALHCKGLKGCGIPLIIYATKQGLMESEVSLYKIADSGYIYGMRKRLILPVAAMLITAAFVSIHASDITIAKSDLDFFIGTYDADQNTFTDFTVSGWDTANTMGYFNAISEFPDTKGVYFGLAPWYVNLAKAVRPFPDLGLMFVSFVDIKLSHAAHAIVTKWEMAGDSLKFVCVTNNFPDLGGAPNLDGCYLLPDSSYFMIARSAGGDMFSIWHKYSFLYEETECTWKEFYSLESQHLMFEEEFTEAWCRLIDSLAPEYSLTVVKRLHKAKGDMKKDGSYVHEVAAVDSAIVDLWKLIQEARNQ